MTKLLSSLLNIKCFLTPRVNNNKCTEIEFYCVCVCVFVFYASVSDTVHLYTSYLLKQSLAVCMILAKVKEVSTNRKNKKGLGLFWDFCVPL